MNYSNPNLRHSANSLPSKSRNASDEVLPGATPIERMARVARTGNLDVFQAAIADYEGSPADLLKERDGSGSTLLHLAAEYANPAILDLLLSLGPEEPDLHASTPGDRNTPLHLAANPRVQDEEAAIECVRLLLAAGANPKIINGERERPEDITPSPTIRALLRQQLAVGRSDVALDEDDVADD
ncbi:hypothetical protein GGF32_008243 [Allomyces javanicus]|nr:hypothetical protein GGF32_008243 [Allomyces javanicus]